ncbi:Xaa-Pro dipeptidase [Desulfosarcina alkanivorans]|uniref:Xaa-Pro aminopeptidase n=2 Tax=Desulfosarcina alkanivorans TaxID=571177 RepID=A0A5K7YHG7_9BACT|nr:Xaa-Pro dipeptidase [Desulfosarcina alkanivorans]
MFSAECYTTRRQCLKTDIESGLILFLGNGESAINAADNCYFFRQDSSFLYFWGIDLPNLAAVIDVDAETETVFGDDPSMDDMIWTGPQPSLSERCKELGIHQSATFSKLHEIVGAALKKNRPVHFLPPYRMDQMMQLSDLFCMNRQVVAQKASKSLIRSVVRQRSVKSDAELAQIESAITINGAMQTTAMRMATPGRHEREVVGAIEGLAYGLSGRKLPFRTIFSIHGQVLHNHCHDNQMKAGDLAICDCGAESSMGYASDTTRTIPVGGRFTGRQKDIYEVVLGMQMDALAAMKPGVPFRDIHLLAARRLSSDFKKLGLMHGDVSEMVESGAYALFFPHGLGHMMGLDVHDMESLGENHVGYTENIRRDTRFGLNRLRLAKPLEPGFVVTVEPGVYFIPPLIRQWRAENRFGDHIDYRRLEPFLDFGGVRIEDDVRVTSDGAAVLGPPIPKTVPAVEACCNR